MIRFSANYVLKYFKEYAQDFTYTKSLFLFLTFLKFAQRRENRIAYYTYCCFLTRQNKIIHRTYATWVCNFLNIKSFHIEAKNFLLFRTKEDNLAFHALECDYNNVYIESFTADYFYDNKRDYCYLLHYSSYILKVDFSMYAILWHHVERIRQRKYNEYVKMHPKINYHKNWHIRTAYTQAPEAKYGIVPHIWIREWFMQAKKQKYHIYFSKGLVKSDLLDKKQNPLVYNYYLKSLDYQLMKVVSKIEMTNKTRLNNKFFRRSVSLRWCLETCHHLSNYANYYPDQIRFDIFYLWQCFYLCVLSPQTYFKRIQIDLATLENRLFAEFMNKTKVIHYFSLNAFLFDANCLTIYKNVRFTYKIFELLICTGVTCLPSLVKWNTVQWRLPVEIMFHDDWSQYTNILDHLNKTSIFTDYLKVNPTVGHTYISTYYDYWRSFNTDTLYRWFDGRLTNYYVFLCYDLDSYLFNRDTWTWNQIYERWTTELSLYPVDLVKILAPPNSRRPLALRNILARLKNPLKYQNTGKIVVPQTIRALGWATVNRTVPFIVYHTIKTLYIRAIRVSWKLSYVAFFCLFNILNKPISDYYCEKQGNNLQSLFHAQMIVRRILTNYKTRFKRFRRAVFDTKGTTIHGKNPARLEDWKVHANWMRIIGLLPYQLPYYYIKDDEWWNYINELWMKRKKDRINMVNSKLYYIENV